MILLGIFLIVAYSQIQKDLKNVDMDSAEGRAGQGIYTLGVIFLVSGVTLLLSSSKTPASSGAAPQVNKGSVSNDLILGFAIALGIVLTTLSGILVSKTTGTAKSWGIVLLVAGLMFIVGCGAMLFSKNSKTLQGKKAEFSYCGMY